MFYVWYFFWEEKIKFFTSENNFYSHPKWIIRPKQDLYWHPWWAEVWPKKSHCSALVAKCTVCYSVNNTSVRKYWKILFYSPNTDTGTFYGGSTDIATDVQYPEFNNDILVFPVFYSISILCFKPLIDSCYLSLLSLT